MPILPAFMPAFFWQCTCCPQVPAFFCPCVVTNEQYPNGVASVGLYDVNCKKIVELQAPPTQYAPQQQVTTITPANVQAGSQFSLTIQGNTVNYTTSVGTAADVCEGLENQLNSTLLPPPSGPDYPRKYQFTPSVANGVLTLTGTNAGVSFAVTAAASGSTATITVQTVYQNWTGFPPQAIASLYNYGAPLSYNPNAGHLLIYPFVYQFDTQNKQANVVATLPPFVPGYGFISTGGAGNGAEILSNTDALYNGSGNIVTCQGAQFNSSNWGWQFSENGQLVRAYAFPSYDLPYFAPGPRARAVWNDEYDVYFANGSQILLAEFPISEWMQVVQQNGDVALGAPATGGDARVSDGSLVNNWGNGLYCVSQSGVVVWQAQFQAFGLVCDASSNTYGIVESFVSGTEVSTLVKFDINGNLLWSVQAPSLLRGICWGNGTIYGWGYTANVPGSDPPMAQIARYAWKDVDGTLTKKNLVCVPPNVLPTSSIGGMFQTIEHVNGRPGTFGA
jgi:hypothetical protein